MNILDRIKSKFYCPERNLEFIWGVSACEGEASLYQANDLEVIYNKKTKLYTLGLETAFLFNNKEAECNYLKDMLSKFTEYMTTNKLSTEYVYPFFFSNPFVSFSAYSMKELYFNFSVFVNGYCNFYKNNSL